MAVIKDFPGCTRKPTPDAILDGAKGELTEVLVIGICDNGEDWFASSSTDTSKILFMLEKLKFKILRGDFN